MATEKTPDEPLHDNSLMPFGKHKGKALVNIPAHYFIWLYNDGCTHPGVKKYIIDNLDALQKEANKTKPYRKW